MHRMICNTLLLTTILALAACNLNIPSDTPASTPAALAIPAIALTVQTQNDPNALNAVGQTVHYSYVVTNTGTMPLAGPVTVTGDKAAGTCPDLTTVGNLDGSFDPNETITCSGSYTITQADLAAGSVTNIATASAGGINSAQANAVVTLATTADTPSVTSTPQATPTSSYVPGSTIQHTVIKGEWLIQIARCYGADYTATRRANPRIVFPNLIYPNTIVTVPNAGSKGTIYGPPCVVFHTVQAGDTWASIAQAYNADVLVLQAANRGVALTVGKVIKVPVNSAGGPTPPPPGPSITAFSFTNPAANGVINQSAHTIAVTVPSGTNLTALVPTITHNGASINPASGVAQNFTNPVTYTVTAANGSTQAYTVTVTVAPASSTKAITAFSFVSPAVTGVINEAAHTISVTVPTGTNVTAIIPTITHNGASINPASGVAQNFTNPVTYTVTAADGTTQAYTVTVTVAPASSTKAITAFSFASPTATGVINEAAHTIAVTVPAGTNVNALVPTITHNGASVNPASGVAQNFTNPVTYTVTAADGSTQAYTVTVTVAPVSSTKAITAFSFASPAANGVINETAHTIGVTVPAGTNLTALVPTITHTGASINPSSGAPQNFTNPVTYTVTAADGSIQAYTVTVTVTPSGDMDLTLLLRKKFTDPEANQFREMYTDGPCGETVPGSRMLNCRSKTHEDPFVRFKVTSLEDSTVIGISMFPTFLGKLPNGLTWGMARGAVENKLGAPLGADIDNGNTTIDAEYQSSSDLYRLWITYDANANVKTICVIDKANNDGLRCHSVS